jgi:hypothetical protein
MEKIIIGLCSGRHEIPSVTEYIFENTIDPLDLDYMTSKCHEKLVNADEVVLFVTGLTVALISVINYCCQNHIILTLMHFDRNSNTYYSQMVKTQVDYDFLVEGGYKSKKRLDVGCM